MHVDVDIMDVLDVDPGTDAKTWNPTTSSFSGVDGLVIHDPKPRRRQSILIDIANSWRSFKMICNRNNDASCPLGKFSGVYGRLQMNK